MNMLPLFHKFDGKRVLIFGGGKIAYQKIQVLLSTGAEIRVIAPKVIEEIEKLVHAKKIQWISGSYTPKQMKDEDFVIGATNAPSINMQISKEAQAHGLLVNIVDQPELCNCYFGSVTHWGPVTIGISTSGKCPALAKKLRKEIESIPILRNSDQFFDLASLRDKLSHASDRKQKLEETLETISTSSRSTKGKIYIVGSGSGSIDSLTIKAWNLLQTADYVFYDALVAPEILELVQCPKFYVGKRMGTPSTSQRSINHLLTNAASKHKTVVRLHGGDPMIFGRGSEEALYLQSEGIEYEIVPGISAFQQAAASAQAVLTERGTSRTIQMMTGQTKDNDLDHLPHYREQTVYAVYMGITNVSAIVEKLKTQSFPPNLPSMIVENAGRPHQRIFSSTLDELESVIHKERIQSPAVILLGHSIKRLHENQEHNLSEKTQKTAAGGS